MKILPAFLLFLFLCSGLAKAGDEIQINELLKQGGNVSLESGVYEIEGPILIGSDTVLTGEKDTIIRVSASSSQWFTGMTGLICSKGPVDNVVIQGFQIDGNLDQLPRSYADHAGGDHNAERAIIINGQTSRFSTNITIRDLEIYDCYSDAVHVRFARNVNVYNNFVSNCQHSGLYYVSVIDGIMKNNEVAGITSDNIRLDNCVNNIVTGNILYSYTGDNSNGAYKKGQNSLQIANQGFSHNGGSEKPTKTENIEIFGNLFADTGLRTIWLDSTGKGVKNVFIHDNEFAESEPFETSGEPVKIHDNKFVDVPQVEINGKPVSIDNLPTKETSHNVFDSIYELLNVEISDTGNIKQDNLKAINPEWEKKGKTEAYIYLAGYEGQIIIDNETYIPKAPSECARVLIETNNLAARPVSQEHTIKLSDGANNSLIVDLEVKTVYRVQKHKEILGFKVPYFKEKSQKASFKKTFQAPRVFPTFEPPKCIVRHYKDSHAIVIIPDAPGVVKTAVFLNNSSAREYRLIGEVEAAENGFKSTHFTGASIWKFKGPQMKRGSSGLRIEEPFNISDLKIEITTPYETREPQYIEYIVIEDTSSKIFNLANLTLLVLILTYGRAIYRIFYKVLKIWL